MPLDATTTLEQDRKTEGQRRVNMTWELTQAIIAVGVTAAYVVTTARGVNSEGLGNAFFLVIGFYFSRTNHARFGDVLVSRSE